MILLTSCHPRIGARAYGRSLATLVVSAAPDLAVQLVEQNRFGQVRDHRHSYTVS